MCRFARWLAFAATPLAILAAFVGSAAKAVEEGNWPRDIEVPEGIVTIYQPQLESFKGDKLTARAAVSVMPTGATEPVFGAVWVAARVSTDRDARTVELLEIKVTDAKFPNAEPEKLEKLKGLLEQEIPNWDLSISLDRLLTMLDLVEREQAAAEDLNTRPPKIIFVKHPAVLVTIDGEPAMRAVEGTRLMRVVNTPFFIVLDGSSQTYYLKGGEEWLSAADVMGPWHGTKSVPASVVALAAAESEQGGQGASSGSDQMPQIIVTTEPAEVIQTDREPEYSPLADTGLLYVSNTASDVFMEIESQRYYILLSGRWYRSSFLEGPWFYVRSDGLPDGFARIPPGSPKGYVLASIAGTVEARDAAHEAYIPQTGAIKRDAALAVTYDGDPQFEDIEGTEMAYAVNTAHAVIRVEGKYYCCSEAAWFVADDPLGPWVVCASVPQVIYTIPPSCPHYNVKYVYVYDSTPDVVYVGYTPGYTGTYIYGGTVVYGTGYYYRGWYRRVYYPRPVTYGYGVVHRPYRGWYSAAGFVAGAWVGSRWGGWWGGWRDIDIDVDRTITTPRGTWESHIDIDIDRGWGGRDIDIDRDISFEPNRNIYERRENRERNWDRPGRGPDRTGPGGDRGIVGTPERGRVPASRPEALPERRDDVFADRDGNVFRRTDQGWQQRTRSDWEQSSDVSRSRSNLDRQHVARQRGTQRTNSFRQSRSFGAGGSAGGRRGGGRRR